LSTVFRKLFQDFLRLLVLRGDRMAKIYQYSIFVGEKAKKSTFIARKSRISVEKCGFVLDEIEF